MQNAKEQIIDQLLVMDAQDGVLHLLFLLAFGENGEDNVAGRSGSDSFDTESKRDALHEIRKFKQTSGCTRTLHGRGW